MELEAVWESIRTELKLLWAAHEAAGLKGHMRLYSLAEQAPWRSQEAGLEYWIGPEDTEAAIGYIQQHYNDGSLPNTTLLLDPVVHTRDEAGNAKPLGSGVLWCTSLTLGVNELNDEQAKRIHDIGLAASAYTRGENPRAGLKILGFTKEPFLPHHADDQRDAIDAIYSLAHCDSPDYYRYYLLSGLQYLGTHGMFMHPGMVELCGDKTAEEMLKAHTIKTQTALDAAKCWESYDCHHSLYERFGRDTKDIEHNVKFYNLCARDIQLFDATGPLRKGADETFEFVVPGLIPRGSITLLAGSGGTGKSSIAHHLCVMAAIDYEKDEQPTWLGQPLNLDYCKGICVYFSGEDGPAIVNARGELFDPETRAKRLMFQRTDFGEGETISGFLKRLAKMPEVPIMVIDPARKYLTGNEDDSDVVSEFFEAIEEFAITKQCAVIVVHHLQKGAYPQSARQVLDELRGSQVFIDRPRVVIGMFRDGMHTIVGLAKNNIPPSLGMIQDERVFARDPKTLKLVWLPGEEGIRRKEMTQEEIEALQAEKELKAVKAKQKAS